MVRLDSPDLVGDIARRGDLSGQGPPPKVTDVQGTRLVRDFKGSWEWHRRMHDIPWDSLPLSGITASQLLESGRQIVGGGSVQNTAAVGGFIEIRDGADASGTLIAHLGLAATSTQQLLLPEPGVLCEIGVYIVVSAVTVTAAFWVKHLWKYPFTPPGE